MSKIDNLISKLRNFYIKSIGKENKSDFVKYYVDDLNVALNRFVLRGWIADEKKGNVSPKLVFKNATTERSFELAMLERTDVSDYLGIQDKNLGFDVDLNINTALDSKVFFEYQTDTGNQRIYITDIKANKKNGEIIIKDLRKSGTEFGDMYTCLGDNDLEPEEAVLNQVQIDVIVPVYNGFDYLEKLFETISNTGMNYRVLVVNDHSSDERVLPYLKDLTEKDSRIFLIDNEENLGFVKSVNIALKQSSNHVAIVNTDVVLPNHWLERLMYPIEKYKDVASSTPFTNSGTICSFPVFGENNDIYMGLDIQDIDDEFSKINPQYTYMPTGVGFCMGMNKDAIAKVGLFDEETFYKGYGEENDWCQRAIAKGYKNVMVENLFVWHKHGGSFLPEDKKRYVERNLELISKRYPDYNINVANYCATDPVAYIRNYIQWSIIRNRLDKFIVVFDHDWGGGANTYLIDRIPEWNQNGYGIFRIIFSLTNQLLVELPNGDSCCTLESDGFEEIPHILGEIACEEIYVNEIISYPNLCAVQNAIVDLKREYNSKLIMLIHDFLAVCPSIYLMNSENVHCYKPDLDTCRECFLKNDNLFNHQYASIDDWRSDWKTFLSQCDEVRTFSENTKSYLSYWYPDIIKKITVVPHKVEYIERIKEKKCSEDTLVIGYIGNLMRTKGSMIISDMAKLIRERNIDAKIVVIGQKCENYEVDSDIEIYGVYERDKLPLLIENYKVDVIFIASIWPETFSYTTEEAIKMGLTVAAFDIGAPAERLKNYDKSIIIDEIDAETALQTIVSALRK